MLVDPLRVIHHGLGLGDRSVDRSADCCGFSVALFVPWTEPPHTLYTYTTCKPRATSPKRMAQSQYRDAGKRTPAPNPFTVHVHPGRSGIQGGKPSSACFGRAWGISGYRGKYQRGHLGAEVGVPIGYHCKGSGGFSWGSRALGSWSLRMSYYKCSTTAPVHCLSHLCPPVRSPNEAQLGFFGFLRGRVSGGQALITPPNTFV